jgi:hypothetical protein
VSNQYHDIVFQHSVALPDVEQNGPKHVTRFLTLKLHVLMVEEKLNEVS